jgi:succinoglycan biosynthesis transport protein ExoP
MDQQLDEPDLRSYLGVIARRKWWVLGVTTLFFAAAIAMSVIPDPLYRARAKVQTPSGIDLTHLAMGQTGSFVPADRQAADQLEYIDSNTVRYAALSAVSGDLPASEMWNVNVEPVARSDNGSPSSSVAVVSLVSTDPETAAQLVAIYAETYVQQWNADRVEELVDVMAALGQRVNDIQAQIDQLQAQQSEALANDQGNQVDDSTAQLDGLRNDRNFYRSQLDRLQLSSEMPGGSARVISIPLRPDTPISPNIPMNLAIGLVFGLFLGVAVAFLRDYFDDSVKSKEIVERVTGVPALGLIPKFDTNESELVTAAAPAAPAAEAFRSLRTSVKFLSVDREVRVVQVTSPSPGEGKTVTATNLAMVFAQAGDRVVLVGADLRRPRAEDILGVPLTPGLTGVLIGEVALPQAIRSVEGLPNLSVLPAGYPPPNPSELLSGERARRLIDVLAQTYDLVVLDCPPVLPVTDALVLARMADTTLLVTSANRTSRRALDRGVEVLQQVGAPLMGTVMTSLARGATFGDESYRYDGSGLGRYKKASRAPSAGNGYGRTGALTSVPLGAGQYQAEGDPLDSGQPTTTTGAFTSAFGPGHVSQPDGEHWADPPQN